MQLVTILFTFLISFGLWGQEIGVIKKGDHSIKLIQEDDSFVLVYSDITSTKGVLKENSIRFSVKESVYDIIMKGYRNKKGHQVIVDVGNDTIVKLDYHFIKGENLLKIRQNNLTLNTFGASIYIKESEIIELFGGIQ